MQPTYLLAAKFTVVGMELLLLAVILVHRRDHRGIVTAFFLYCMANYVMCTVVGKAATFWPGFLFYAGCMAVPVALWLFAIALFDDDFRLRPWHIILGIIFVLFRYATFFYKLSLPESLVQDDSLAFALSLFSQIAALGFILSALALAVGDWKSDLVEQRRRFRILLTSVAGIYAVIVTVVEIALQEVQAPVLLEAVHTAGLVAVTLFFGAQLVQPRGDLFPELRRGNPEPPGEQTFAPETLARLRKLMLEDRVWLEDGFTIGGLAERLQLPEYRLRRLINGTLGFRNFNEFLNRFRVARACAILADPEQRDVPVLRIAMDLGYGSLAPFNRAFRGLTGLSPTEYRRSPEPARAPGLPFTAAD